MRGGRVHPQLSSGCDAGRLPKLASRWEGKGVHLEERFDF